jgi:hypothetical protein
MSSSASGKRGRPPLYLNSRSVLVQRAPCEPGDEQHASLPRKWLLAMDARFVERLERAIENGDERRENRSCNAAAPRGRRCSPSMTPRSPAVPVKSRAAITRLPAPSCTACAACNAIPTRP